MVVAGKYAECLDGRTKTEKNLAPKSRDENIQPDRVNRSVNGAGSGLKAFDAQ